MAVSSQKAPSLSRVPSPALVLKPIFCRHKHLRILSSSQFYIVHSFHTYTVQVGEQAVVLVRSRFQSLFVYVCEQAPGQDTA